MYELKNYNGETVAYINIRNIVTIETQLARFYKFAKIYINGMEILVADRFSDGEIDKVQAYLDKIVKELSVE